MSDPSGEVLAATYVVALFEAERDGAARAAAAVLACMVEPVEVHRLMHSDPDDARVIDLGLELTTDILDAMEVMRRVHALLEASQETDVMAYLDRMSSTSGSRLDMARRLEALVLEGRFTGGQEPVGPGPSVPSAYPRDGSEG